jgi:hypothetical protein
MFWGEESDSSGAKGHIFGDPAARLKRLRKNSHSALQRLKA